MNGIRKDSPDDYAVIKGFVIDYLFANGHNVEHMVDDIKAKWGNKGHLMRIVLKKSYVMQ